jgi:serine/threonine protein kinase
MSTSFQLRSCPNCGATIPEDSPQGLCPTCLLKVVAATTCSASRSGRRPDAPSIEALQSAFPHLDILEFVGQGGMGFVFKARQSKLGRLVALKVLPESLSQDPAFAERFAREGKLLARLNHSNIVSIYDFGQAGGFFYLLMEYVDGVNLRQAMSVSRFTPRQALEIVPKICAALQYAHGEGVLHRDIKPENVLLDTKGRVKLADFGIAKLLHESGERRSVSSDSVTVPSSEDQHLRTDLTAAGATVGTPNYMSPEQLDCPSEVDPRSDIYSLGVVFYELLTGELPVGRFAPPSEKIDISPQIDQVVLRVLEKKRERRHQSAQEMKTEVEAVVVRESSADLPRTKEFIPASRTSATKVALGVVIFFLGLMGGLLVTSLMPISATWQTAVSIPLAIVSPLLAVRFLSSADLQRRWDLINLRRLAWLVLVLTIPFWVFDYYYLGSRSYIPESRWTPAGIESCLVVLAYAGTVLLPLSGVLLVRASSDSSQGSRSRFSAANLESPESPFQAQVPLLALGMVVLGPVIAFTSVAVMRAKYEAPMFEWTQTWLAHERGGRALQQQEAEQIKLEQAYRESKDQPSRAAIAQQINELTNHINSVRERVAALEPLTERPISVRRQFFQRVLEVSALDLIVPGTILGWISLRRFRRSRCNRQGLILALVAAEALPLALICGAFALLFLVPLTSRSWTRFQEAMATAAVDFRAEGSHPYIALLTTFGSTFPWFGIGVLLTIFSTVATAAWLTRRLWNWTRFLASSPAVSSSQ